MDTVPILKRLAQGGQSKAGAAVAATKKEVCICFIASVVEIAAAASKCDTDGKCEDEVAWGVAVGVIGTCVCLLVMLLSALNPYHNVISVFLALLWTAGVGVLTFDEPWTFTGNGYFSSWVAFLSSAYWALSVNFGSDLIVTV